LMQPKEKAMDYLDEAVRLAGITLVEEGMQVKDAIKALRDTDYKDPEAQFKMVQLLKGLAVSAKDDETAKEFLSKVSDALTTAAKSVLGESLGITEKSHYGNTGFSHKELYELLAKSMKKGEIEAAIGWYEELKAKKADMHLADNIMMTGGKLPDMVKKMR